MSCHDVYYDFRCVYCRRVGNWVAKCVSRKNINCGYDVLITPLGGNSGNKSICMRSSGPRSHSGMWINSGVIRVIYALVVNAYFAVTIPVSNVCCNGRKVILLTDFLHHF